MIENNHMIPQKGGQSNEQGKEKRQARQGPTNHHLTYRNPEPGQSIGGYHQKPDRIREGAKAPTLTNRIDFSRLIVNIKI